MTDGLTRILSEIVEQTEALSAERKSLSQEIAGLYQQAQLRGLDKHVLRMVLRHRADPNAAIERNALAESYLRLLGETILPALTPPPTPKKLTSDAPKAKAGHSNGSLAGARTHAHEGIPDSLRHDSGGRA